MSRGFAIVRWTYTYEYSDQNSFILLQKFWLLIGRVIARSLLILIQIRAEGIPAAQWWRDELFKLTSIFDKDIFLFII